MDLKWRNKGLWLSLGSLIVMILNDSLGITPGQSEPYVDLVLGVLIAAGVISNPSKGEGFKDKEDAQ